MRGCFSVSRRSFAALTIVSSLFVLSLTPATVPARGEASPPADVTALPVISWITANVSAQRIYQLLYDLQNYSTRYVETTNCNASAEYIVRDYSNSSNLIVQSQYFLWGGYTLRNVIAILPAFNPANKTAYVVGGHYDSWSVNNPMVWAPGVDDDGSGTVAAMEVARVLSPYRFNATLIFAAWTAEEVGLVGSDVHASSLRSAGQQVGAVIGMDMIGNYVSNMGLDLVHDGFSEWVADALMRANTDYGIGLQLTKYYSLTPNSDHASFWAYGYNAIMAAEADFSPNWHQDTDTINNVNITLITKATQVAAAALAEMAGIFPPGYGAVTLDRQAYKPGDFPLITLYDADLNANPGAVEVASVNISSDSEPAGEQVTLTETGADTSIFAGTIELNGGPPVVGKLEVKDGDTVRVEYIDVDPPGVRTATARIDAILPVISGVYAIPDVDSAEVHWKTNEPADSTVLYGEAPALGMSASATGLVLDHSVSLTGLKSSTRYYYDVRSADEAGNTATADNGGNHFSFVTLNGFVVRPKLGYVGYVKSNDPGGNYFGGPDVLVGQGFQGTYLGAAQLDTSATPIPPAATLVRATFEALGKEWVYEGNGQWNLKLLNSSIDPGWTTKGYTAINGATVDAIVPPTLTYPDLLPGVWNTFTFQPAQYDMLRTRVNTGTISFRFDGPRGPDRWLFNWHSGNDYALIAPRLRVAYSLTGDTAGPLVSYLAATPNPTMASMTTDVHLTVSDETTGGGNVSYAEYFWGIDPGTGLATPLLPDDGGFDSMTEDVTFTIDVSSIPRGIYTLGFRGRDQSDNWGPTRILTLYVGVWDLYPPSIDSLTFNPPTPESRSPMNVSVRVTDDIAVYGAWVEYTDPMGNPRGNFSMSFDAVSGRYYHVASFAPLGTYNAMIWANDTSDKWNSTSGTFDVVDTTKPVIVQISSSPPVQNYGLAVVFTAWVTDDFLATVNVAFYDPMGVPSGNYSTTRIGPPGDNYTHAQSFPALGQWTYCFWATDTSGNPAGACDYFTIVDRIPPTIVSAVAIPPQQQYGQLVSINAWVTDQYIDSVWVNVTDPGGASIGNFSMTRTVPWEDNWTFSRSYMQLGTYTFVVWAYDESGNPASASGIFIIVDRTSPVFEQVIVDPDPVEVLSWTKVSAQVTDIQTVVVSAEVRSPTGSSLGNTTMSFNAVTGKFERTVAGLLELGTYSYTLWAVDAGGYGALYRSNFVVRDTTRPVVALLGIQTVHAESYNDANVTVRIVDNYMLNQAALTIEWRNSTGALIVNTSLSFLSGTDYYSSIRLSSEGMNDFIVTAMDTSGNAAVLTGQVNVVLGLPPTARAGDDRNVTAGATLTFNASASSDDFGIERYVWHIVGPGVDETLEGLEVSYTFNESGTYIVILTVHDGADRTSSDTLQVHVSAPVPPTQGGVDAAVVALIIVVVIIAVLLLMFFFLRKKKTEDKETEEEKEQPEEED